MPLSNLNPDLKRHRPPSSRRAPTVDEYIGGILGSDRVVLSRAITLLESTRPTHRRTAQAVLDACLPHAGHSVRGGVTGVPGVGKSTFIEALGTRLVDAGHRLAVLAVDPSSTRTRGSILGDKTRMRRLAAHDDAYVRPSPTAGSLGGVARATREAMLLCEAAGFDVVFVETVGVGQSETTVRSMVDFFLLLALAGAGDELQGIKRGIVEMADALAINKADGNNRQAARRAQGQYERALSLFPPAPSGWTPPVLTCSAETGAGLGAVWDAVTRFRDETQASGFFGEQRRQQARHWMHQTIEHRLRDDFFSAPAVRNALPDIETDVLDGRLSSSAAAEALLRLYRDAGG
jgi:LAO/AO transport system kinase